MKGTVQIGKNGSEFEAKSNGLSLALGNSQQAGSLCPTVSLPSICLSAKWNNHIVQQWRDMTLTFWALPSYPSRGRGNKISELGSKVPIYSEVFSSIRIGTQGPEDMGVSAPHTNIPHPKP